MYLELITEVYLIIFYVYILFGFANISNANHELDFSLGGSSSKSGLAQRALLTVNSKLSGTEGGVAGGVAVPGQVARLIHTAMDPNNLCRLFPGWQPYL